MLQISGIKEVSIPSWTLKIVDYCKSNLAGLDILMEVKLESCDECEEIPILDHFSSLKKNVFLFLFEKGKIHKFLVL